MFLQRKMDFPIKYPEIITDIIVEMINKLLSLIGRK